MKRGLKHRERLPGVWRRLDVETHAPMKRGLKRSPISGMQLLASSRNTCPDEEGTETSATQPAHRPAHRVETHAPMKRGLKRILLDVLVEPLTWSKHMPR